MKGLGDNCGGSSSDHGGSSVAVEPGVSVVPSEGGGDVSGHGGGVVRDGNGDLLDGVDGGVDSLADGLDGVGPGLVHDGLADGLVGPHWAVDLLGAEGWDVLEDGLGDVVSLDDGGGLVGVDGLDGAEGDHALRPLHHPPRLGRGGRRRGRGQPCSTGTLFSAVVTFLHTLT